MNNLIRENIKCPKCNQLNEHTFKFSTLIDYGYTSFIKHCSKCNTYLYIEHQLKTETKVTEKGKINDL